MTSLYVVGVTEDSVGEETVDTEITGSGRGDAIEDGPGIDSLDVISRVDGATVEGDGTGVRRRELRTTLDTVLELGE